MGLYGDYSREVWPNQALGPRVASHLLLLEVVVTFGASAAGSELLLPVRVGIGFGWLLALLQLGVLRSGGVRGSSPLDIRFLMLARWGNSDIQPKTGVDT